MTIPNDLKVADILANGTPNLYFDARVSTADQIVQYLRGIVDQLYMLYYDGYISHFFWEGCHERSLYCRMPFLLPCPPEAFVEYCRLVDAFLKYLNDNLALAIRCEVALGVLAKHYRLTYEVTTISKKMVDIFANNEFEATHNSLDEIYSDPDMADYVLIGIDLAEEEFGKRCDACACDHICEEIEQAAAWLRDHEQDIAGKLFENVEPMYIRGHPGHFQPFMMAWCAMNGGI